MPWWLQPVLPTVTKIISLADRLERMDMGIHFLTNCTKSSFSFYHLVELVTYICTGGCELLF